MTRRRWWLVGIVTLLVLLRAVLPEIVRRQAETRASELLHAQVKIGDVDLGLLRGMVALDDVGLRPVPPPDATPEAKAAAEGAPPVVGWKRFAINLRWWPLVHKTVRLEDVELDEPIVAVDRLADGELNLLAFVPVAAGGEKPPAPEEPGAKPWGAGIDHLVLRSGHVRFRDFAVQGEGEPVDVRLPTIEVRDIALASGLYGGPARSSVDVRVDQGRLRVNTRLWMRDGGVALSTTLRARRMPLERVRLYVPDVGWRELRGELGASLAHHLEPNKRNAVTGTATLDGVEVNVPDVDKPALTWKHLGVDLDVIDLQGHRAAVDKVVLESLTVIVQPEGGELLPAIARKTKEASDEASEKAAAPASKPAGSEAPWRWSVNTVQVSDALVHLLTPQGQRDLGVGLEMHQLAGDGDQPAPTKLAVTMDAATLSLEGDARIAMPGFDGQLAIKDLALPEVPTIAGRLQPAALQNGRLSADLHLTLGSAATPPGDFTMTGKVGLAEFTLVGADPTQFSLAFDKLDVGIDELRLPGVLAKDAERKPPVVRLASIDLAKPGVVLTRTPEGLVLPAPGATPEPSPAPEGAPSPPAQPAPAAPGAAPAAPLDLTVTALHVTDGTVRVTDTTVKPFFKGGLENLDLDVRAMRFPALTVDDLKLTAKSITRGTLQVTGKRSATNTLVEVTGKDIALQPFNPYAAHYSPYSISGGALSVTTKATLKGKTYDSTTALKLDRFDLGGKEGDSLFKQQFGIPIEVALALLRDLQGRIAFDIPVEGDERGSKVSVMTVASQALRAAIVNALASPLKLVGAAFGGKGGESAAPAPIAFAVGRAEPTSDGDKALEGLGGLLASRPGIGITLEASPTQSDARWLEEQSLREELSRGGVFSAIGNLAQRGARERIRKALEERAAGKEGSLDAEDAAKLDEWLAERPKASEKELRALAAARLEKAASSLQQKHGVGANRVTRAEPGAEAGQGDPVVTFDIGAAGAS